MSKCLMLGSGFFPPERKIVAGNEDEAVWTTLDSNPECKPDHIFDLNNIEDGYQLPFAPGEFDEIHAYQVLEHFGRQGDYQGFFAGFGELWRILVPGGKLVADTPALSSPWLWGDPGHCRAISWETLTFLTRQSYEGLGKTTSTDYRSSVNGKYWEILYHEVVGNRFAFVLRKV